VVCFWNTFLFAALVISGGKVFQSLEKIEKIKSTEVVSCVSVVIICHYSSDQCSSCPELSVSNPHSMKKSFWSILN
jgi:hypothetical protein